MCQICGQPNYVTCNCQTVECIPCSADSKCINKIDAECVIYHLDNDKPSELICLGIPNGTSLETALELLDAKLCNASTLETPVTVIDTNTIDFSATGQANHTIQAVAKISSDAGNVLSSTPTGLYAPQGDGKIKVTEGDTLDYLINQIEGGTDGIITLAVTQVDGQVAVTPSLNIPALITLLQTTYHDEWCNLIASCVPLACEAPTEVQVVKANIAPNTYRISWVSPTDNGNITGYEVQYKLKTASTWTTHATITNGFNFAFITGLTGNLLYEFRVVSICTEGGPAPSDSVENINLTCPNVSVTHTADSVTVSFPHLEGDVDSYIIQLLDVTGTHVIKSQGMTPPFESTISYIFSGIGITQSTTYQVRVIPMAGSYVKNNCPLTEVKTDIAESCASPVDIKLVDNTPIACKTYYFEVSGSDDATWYINATLCDGSPYSNSGLVGNGAPSEICAKENTVILGGNIAISDSSQPCGAAIACKTYTFQVFGPDDSEYVLRATLCNGESYNSGRRYVGDGAHLPICARPGTVFINNYGVGGMIITDDSQDCVSTDSCFSYRLEAGASGANVGFIRCDGVTWNTNIATMGVATICARDGSPYIISGDVTIIKENVCSG